MGQILPDDLLTANEAAALLKGNAGSVRRWVREGKLPGFKVGAVTRVSKKDVIAFAKRVTPPSGRMPKTMAEQEAEDAEVDKILKEARIRR